MANNIRFLKLGHSYNQPIFQLSNLNEKETNWSRLDIRRVINWPGNKVRKCNYLATSPLDFLDHIKTLFIDCIKVQRKGGISIWKSPRPLACMKVLTCLHRESKGWAQTYIIIEDLLHYKAVKMKTQMM